MPVERFCVSNEASVMKYVRSEGHIAEWTPAAKSTDILTEEEMISIYGPEQFEKIKQEIDDYRCAIRHQFKETV